jgi:hypothetical protein
MAQYDIFPRRRRCELESEIVIALLDRHGRFVNFPQGTTPEQVAEFAQNIADFFDMPLVRGSRGVYLGSNHGWHQEMNELLYGEGNLEPIFLESCE